MFAEKLSVEERKSLYGVLEYIAQLKKEIVEYETKELCYFTKLAEAMTKIDVSAQLSIIGIFSRLRLLLSIHNRYML